MKLHFELDLATDSRESIAQLANFLNQITNASRKPSFNAQPEVAHNTGSSAAELTPLTAGAAVAGADVAGENPEAKSAPVVVKDPVKRPRAKKEDPEVKPAGGAETPPSGESSAQASVLPTLDDVRTALQAFTSSKGVPAGIELLGDFGAARVSELKEEQFADFIASCK